MHPQIHLLLIHHIFFLMALLSLSAHSQREICHHLMHIKTQVSTVPCQIRNQLHLKHNHPYYHQAQLQLLVCMDMCHWCDFCIYTLKGVAVERIWLFTDCNECIPELESYFDGYMLLEIISPKLKLSYVLYIVSNS